MSDADILVNQFGEIVESRCGSAGAHLEHMSKSATYSERSLDLRWGCWALMPAKRFPNVPSARMLRGFLGNAQHKEDFSTGYQLP